MYLVFFLIWIIFNGQFTLEIAAFGVVVSGLIYWFICRFLGYRPSDDIWLCKRFFLLIHYVFVLVTEILKANMAVFKMIYSSRPGRVDHLKDCHICLQDFCYQDKYIVNQQKEPLAKPDIITWPVAEEPADKPVD